MSARNAEHTTREQAALPAETADKLRALVRTLAKMAAEADYREHKQHTADSPKGSSP